MTSSEHMNIGQGWAQVLLLDAPSDMNYASQTNIKQARELCVTKQ